MQTGASAVKIDLGTIVTLVGAPLLGYFFLRDPDGRIACRGRLHLSLRKSFPDSTFSAAREPLRSVGRSMRRIYGSGSEAV